MKPRSCVWLFSINWNLYCNLCWDLSSGWQPGITSYFLSWFKTEIRVKGKILNAKDSIKSNDWRNLCWFPNPDSGPENSKWLSVKITILELLIAIALNSSRMNHFSIQVTAYNSAMRIRIQKNNAVACEAHSPNQSAWVSA